MIEPNKYFMSSLPITSIYFDPTTDFGFKKLFGEENNKDLLMDFLNGLLPNDYQISSLTFQKTEQLPDHDDERKAIFDILCQNSAGETFIVEMQKIFMPYFIDRSLYYTTFPIQSQAPKGKWDFDLKRIFLIGILDFEYDKNIQHFKKRQLLRSCALRDEIGVLMTDKLHFKFLQLPYFNKKQHHLTNHFDKWCFFLQNLENINVIPDILKEPIFMKAFDVAKVSNLSKEDYVLYQISKSKKYDMELIEEEAERRGLEKGKIEGKIEGAKEKERSIVIGAHKKNIAPQQISDVTGIPLEKVLDIIKKYASI